MSAGSDGRWSRPYAATGGRTRAPDATLRIDTQIALSGQPSGQSFSEQHHHVLLVLRGAPVALAELASVMGLPVGVVAVLVDDLRACGMVTAEPPADMSQSSNVTDALLRRLHAALIKDLEKDKGRQRAN